MSLAVARRRGVLLLGWVVAGVLAVTLGVVEAPLAVAQPVPVAGEGEAVELPMPPAKDPVVSPVDPVADADLGMDDGPGAGAEPESFDAETSVVVSRTEFSETYENVDGTSTVMTSTAPVSVPDGAGWAPIDTTVRVGTEPGTGEDRLVVADHPLSPSFAASGDSGELVRVQVADGVGASLSLPQGLPVPAQQLAGEADRVVYEDVLDGADVVYEVEEASVKETIVLAERPADGVASWTFDLDTEGLTPVAGSMGEVVLVDAAGAAQLVVLVCRAFFGLIPNCDSRC